MSESGSEMRIASGSMKLPNCTTRMRYISITAMPSAKKICPNTSCWPWASPPSDTATPGGIVNFLIRAIASFVTSPEPRRDTFA